MSKFNPFGSKDKEKEKTSGKGDTDVIKEENEEDLNPDNKPSEEKEEEGSGVCLMKRGDYMVHVYIE